MAHESFVSAATARSWNAFAVSTPFRLEFAVWFFGLLSFIVSVVINITAANEKGNDYGPGAGWAALLPAPAITLFFSTVNLAVCKFYNLKPLYCAIYAVFGGLLNVILAAIGIVMYEWHTIAWLPSVFMLVSFLIYVVYFSFAARAFRNNRKKTLDAAVTHVRVASPTEIPILRSE